MANFIKFQCQTIYTISGYHTECNNGHVTVNQNNILFIKCNDDKTVCDIRLIGGYKFEVDHAVGKGIEKYSLENGNK